MEYELLASENLILRGFISLLLLVVGGRRGAGTVRPAVLALHRLQHLPSQKSLTQMGKIEEISIVSIRLGSRIKWYLPTHFKLIEVIVIFPLTKYKINFS